MLFSKEDVQNILRQFDAGLKPVRILNELNRSGFPGSLELSAVEQCLRDNGRQISTNKQPSNAAHGHQSHGAGHASNSFASSSHAAPGPPAANQKVRQLSLSAHAAVRNSITTDDAHALYDPGPTMTWNDQADRFTISAHRFGKTVDEIWATLRSNGYDIAKTEVIASLNGQGLSKGELKS